MQRGPLRLKVVALAIVVVGVAVDLWSKSYMQDWLGLDPDFSSSKQSVEVIPGFLAWSGTWNEGITWGFFRGATQPILFLTGAASLGILAWFVFTKSTSRLLHVSLAMILGGAAGNLYDRWKWHKVRDFVDVRFGDWHYPAFNVADSMIVVGVAMILWHELFGRRGPKPSGTGA